MRLIICSIKLLRYFIYKSRLQKRHSINNKLSNKKHFVLKPDNGCQLIYATSKMFQLCKQPSILGYLRKHANTYTPNGRKPKERKNFLRSKNHKGKCCIQSWRQDVLNVLNSVRFKFYSLPIHDAAAIRTFGRRNFPVLVTFIPWLLDEQTK